MCNAADYIVQLAIFRGGFYLEAVMETKENITLIVLSVISILIGCGSHL